MHSMEDRDGLIWCDGEMVPWREARVHVLSYTFQHGAGFFEGVRAYDGCQGTAIFRLRDHTERFFGSAKILQMEMPFTRDEIDAAQIEVVRATGLRNCYIRPVAYYDGKAVGVSAAGNQVHVAVAAWEWNAYLGADAQENGIRVTTSSYSRHHINSAMGKAKATGHYINSMMAVTEAKAQGFQDALMLDTQGYVAECSTSNIFIFRKGKLFTPERSTILEGITRETLMILAAERGFPVEERRVTRDEIYVADEVFVTGTAAEVTPMISLDGRPIGTGRPGELTRLLQQDYRDAVEGRNQSKLDWLTPVGNSSVEEDRRKLVGTGEAQRATG
jgi:branched-chain amino acid aminotransferase